MLGSPLNKRRRWDAERTREVTGAQCRAEVARQVAGALEPVIVSVLSNAETWSTAESGDRGGSSVYGEGRRCEIAV